MADTSARVILEAILRDEDARKELAKLQASTAGVGKAGKKVGKDSKSWLAQMKAGWLAIAAVVVGVTRVVVRFGKKAIAAAEENEVAQLKFRKVFRGSMDVARAAVKDLTANYAMSATEATKMLSGIQDLLVPMGLMRSEAAKVSGTVATLASDIAAFNGQPTEQVITAIQSAMVGMNRPMMQYGVVLSAATVTQEAMNMGLHDGVGELTAAARAQAALSLITQGSTDAIGAMEDQWDTWAVSMKRVKAFGDDVTNMIGDKLVNAFKPALEMLTEFIGRGEGLQKIQKWVGWVIHSFKLLADIIRALNTVVRSVWSIFNVTLFIPLKAALLAIGQTIKLAFTGQWKEIGAVWKENANKLADDAWDAIKKRGEAHKETFAAIMQDLRNIAQAGNEERNADADAADEASYEAQMARLREYLYGKQQAEIEFGEETSNWQRAQSELRTAMATQEWATFVSLGKQAMTEISKAIRANLSVRLAAIGKSKSAAIAALDAELKAGTITADEYADARAAAEKSAEMKIAVAKRKAFFAEKKAKIANVIMAGALALIQAFAQLGPVAGLIAGAAITILTGVQLAQIDKQQPPPLPALALGGVVRHPTTALIGERGPEAVIPLPDWLADRFSDRFGGEGETTNNMGPVSITVEGAGDPAAVAEAVYEKQMEISDELGRGNEYRD